MYACDSPPSPHRFSDPPLLSVHMDKMGEVCMVVKIEDSDLHVTSLANPGFEKGGRALVADFGSIFTFKILRFQKKGVARACPSLLKISHSTYDHAGANTNVDAIFHLISPK